MSTLLLICILVVVAWLAGNLASAYRRSRSTSGDSVAGFSRALDALDPANDDERPVPPRQPRTGRPQAQMPRRQGQRARGRPARARSRKPADAGGGRG